MGDTAIQGVLDALRSAGPAAVFEAAGRTDIYLLTKRGGFGPITKIFPTGDALLAAFADGGEELGPSDQEKLRAAPLRVLAEIAPETAQEAALTVLETTPRSEPLVDAAAHALAGSARDEALAALARALRESAPEDGSPMKRQAFLRREIVRALEANPHPRAGAVLVEELDRVIGVEGAWRALTPRDDTMAAALVHVLGARGDAAAAPKLAAIAAEHPSEQLRKDAGSTLASAKKEAAFAALADRLERHLGQAHAPLGAIELSTAITAVFRLDARGAFDRIVTLGGDRADVVRSAFELLARDAARDRTAKITGPSEGWLKADPRWVDLALDVLAGKRAPPADALLKQSAVEVLGWSGDRRAAQPLVEQLGACDVDVLCRAFERLGVASIVAALNAALPRLGRRERAAVEGLVRMLDPSGAGGAEPPPPPAAPPEAREPGHMIEAAKSGRAACRTCKAPIAKGELRLGEEVPNPFSDSGGTSHRWHHLRCAADKRPEALKIALSHYAGEVPERAELDRAIQAWERKRSSRATPTAFPYAEKAPTGRSRCLQCEAQIPKGALRVAVEREVQTAGMVTRGPGYLHARCASAYVKDPGLFESVRTNSPGLSGADLEALEGEMDKASASD